MCWDFPPCTTITPTYWCHSDPNSPKDKTHSPDNSDPHGQGFHVNYAACAGSTAVNAGGASGNNLNGTFYWKSHNAVTDITDGSSNTLMASEIIVSPDVNGHDVRGRMFNNARQGSTLFTTQYTPNNLATPDRLEYCQSLPQAPCTGTTTNINLSARSYHAGGVNALFCDGSVTFLSNAIDPTVYQALGTRSGGEVVSNNY
jgi:prepilin-type processing-associated H-X9-DG protein